MKKAVSFFTAFLMLISVCSLNAYASEYKDIVLSAEDMSENAYQTVEDALAEARDKASDNLVYRIYVPAGTYTLTSGLHIYSNTQLILSPDTVLNRGFEAGNMIKAGTANNNENYYGYGGYRNIFIDGGVWNSGYIGGSCAMRFAHCKNLTVSNLTIKNIKNAHHIEVAAVDGFYLTNCSFSGMNRTNNSSAEAVQIDILHEYEHFPDYYYYDDTPCKNVYVSGCTFTDLYSGIGTRSGVIGSYFDNINITSNTFKNISEKAVSCFNYRNSNISDNLIDNATMGIVFEYLPPNNISERLFKPNNGKAGNIIQDSSSSISSNTINVNRLSNTVDCCGIYVYGGEIDSKEAGSYSLQKGKYFIKNLSLTENSISCYNSAARGIFLTGVNDSDVISNNIFGYSYANEGINAINLAASSRNTVKGNIINGTLNNGISLYGNDDANSKGNNIDSNNIISVKSYGIRIAGGSTASIKSSNSYNSCGISTICVASVNYSQDLSGVTIKSLTRSSGNRTLIKWYAVDGASGYKIYRSYGYNGPYRQIATVKGDKLMYVDKSSRPGLTYHYKISAYKSASSSTIISPPGLIYGVNL